MFVFYKGICFLFYFILFLISVGGMTVLESKVLAWIQTSSSLGSVCFLGVYHFFLDFLKISVKGALQEFIWKVFWVGGVFIFFVVFFWGTFLLLPITPFGEKVWVWGIFYMGLDSFGSVFLKILFSKIFNFKFVNFSFYRMKSVFIFSESFFFILVISFFILFNSFEEGVGLLEESKMGEGLEESVIGLLFFFSFMLPLSFLIILKSLSVPLDYLEMESELVGGASTEVFGFIFGVWSLLEYVFIFNSSFFFLSLFLSFFNMGSGLCVVGMGGFGMSLVVMVFFLSGVLMSVSFVCVLFLYMKVMFLFLVFFLFFGSGLFLLNC